MQDTADKVFELCGNMRREREVSFLDSLVGTSVIIRFERRAAHDELVSKDTDRPDINFFTMLLFLDHLWRQVIKGTTKGVPVFFWCVNAPTKVSNFNGSLM